MKHTPLVLVLLLASPAALTQASGESSTSPKNPSAPIVLKLDDSPGIQFAAQPALFDIRADGELRRVSWPAPSFGFLVHDLNDNDIVDDGSELFGDATQVKLKAPLRGRPEVRTAKHGCEALEQHDTNEDGVIDALDPIFASLKLWTDLNSNARTEPGELELLSSNGVLALELACRKQTGPGIPKGLEPFVSRYYYRTGDDLIALRLMAGIYLHDLADHDEAP